MPVVTCVVSGVLKTPDNQGLSGVTIRANMISPFIYPTTTTVIMNNEVTTTTDVNGAWSLTLVETENNESTMTITIDYPSGGGNYRRKDYTVIIPDQASVDFSTLIVGQL